MISDTTKAAYLAAARANGNVIEGVITAFYRELAEKFPPGTVLIDGGAHRGYHAKKMAPLASVERIIAVEANPEIAAVLRAAIERSPKLAKIDLKLAALQDDPNVEFLEFLVSTSHPGRSGLNPAMRGIDGTEFAAPITVAATTIDRLAAGAMDRIGFIKLDLEGAEFAAFRGGRETLRASRPPCVFENGPMTPGMNGYTPAEFLGFFDDVGMVVSNFFGEPVTAETLTGFWYAWAFSKDEFAEHSTRLRRLVLRALEPDETPAA